MINFRLDNRIDLTEDTKDELKTGGKNVISYRLLREYEMKIKFLQNKIPIATTKKEIINITQKQFENAMDDMQRNNIKLGLIIRARNNIKSEELVKLMEESRESLIIAKKAIENYETNQNLPVEEKGIFKFRKEESKDPITQEGITKFKNNLNNALLTLNIALAKNYYISDITSVYDDLDKVLAINLDIARQMMSFNDIKEIKLTEGLNIVKLHKTPNYKGSNSIDQTIIPIESVSRIDRYNKETEDWELYLPEAPFGNKFNKFEIGQTYWITTEKEAKIII